MLLELLRHLGQAVEPAVEPLRPYVNRLAPLVSPALAAVAPAVRQAAAATNASLAGLEAWQLVVISVLATLLLGRLLRSMRRALRTAQDKGERPLLRFAACLIAACRCATCPTWPASACALNNHNSCTGAARKLASAA